VFRPGVGKTMGATMAVSPVAAWSIPGG